MTVDELLKTYDEKMKKTVEVLRHEFTSLRTSKASTALLDMIKVELYGTELPLKQAANINTPDARTLVIQPFDKTTLPKIEKAILKSDLGITPNNDGQVIRLVVPVMTEERRKDLVKHAKKMAEDSRIAIRNVRREANDHLKKMEKNHEIREDESVRAQEKMQKSTDAHVKQVDDVLAHKEKEIMEV
ncbi:MAG: ribosome recycling factor [bacterium]|nr:ribosome recycling factor [bacterium]